MQALEACSRHATIRKESANDVRDTCTVKRETDAEVEAGAEDLLCAREHLMCFVIIAQRQLGNQIIGQAHRCRERVFARHTLDRAAKADISIAAHGEIVVGRDEHDLHAAAAHPGKDVDARLGIAREDIGDADIAHVGADDLLGIDQAGELDKVHVFLDLTEARDHVVRKGKAAAHAEHIDVLCAADEADGRLQLIRLQTGERLVEIVDIGREGVTEQIVVADCGGTFEPVGQRALCLDLFFDVLLHFGIAGVTERAGEADDRRRAHAGLGREFFQSLERDVLIFLLHIVCHFPLGIRQAGISGADLCVKQHP